MVNTRRKEFCCRTIIINMPFVIVGKRIYERKQQIENLKPMYRPK